MSSKRHSMPAGPRPLQLANGPVLDGLPAAPLSAFSPSPLSPSTPTTPNGGPRRPSSIIYNPATRPARTAGHRSSLQRSNSVGGALDLQKSVPDRSPVTLAEKFVSCFREGSASPLRYPLSHIDVLNANDILQTRRPTALHRAERVQMPRAALPTRHARSRAAPTYASYSFPLLLSAHSDNLCTAVNANGSASSRAASPPRTTPPPRPRALPHHRLLVPRVPRERRPSKRKRDALQNLQHGNEHEQINAPLPLAVLAVLPRGARLVVSPGQGGRGRRHAKS
ncbi:hypothetical protein B0H12DRAFT_1133947 [Mycena haematopus]|nr:hypothetical protein B0H12DRAFT_1133947 [Mycena haematopus]